MSKAKLQQKSNSSWINLKIPFSESEVQTFRAFLKSTGRSAGPWARIVILKAIKEEIGEKSYDNRD
jgi:hypothetical protein